MKAYSIYEDGKAIMVLLALVPWLPLFVAKVLGLNSSLFQTVWIVVASILSGVLVIWSMTAACVAVRRMMRRRRIKRG